MNYIINNNVSTSIGASQRKKKIKRKILRENFGIFKEVVFMIFDEDNYHRIILTGRPTEMISKRRLTIL